ncbi:MAG: DUF2304 domain-containing protein [Erysipelotrichaceae bacterium]
MSLQLQLVFISASIITLFFVVMGIRKNKLNIDSSILWILWSFLLLILSVFPSLAELIAKSMGFISTSNFIFSIFTFFLYVILFFQTIKISDLKEKNKALVQKLSIKEYEENKNFKVKK